MSLVVGDGRAARRARRHRADARQAHPRVARRARRLPVGRPAARGRGDRREALRVAARGGAAVSRACAGRARRATRTCSSRRWCAAAWRLAPAPLALRRGRRDRAASVAGARARSGVRRGWSPLAACWRCSPASARGWRAWRRSTPTAERVQAGRAGRGDARSCSSGRGRRASARRRCSSCANGARVLARAVGHDCAGRRAASPARSSRVTGSARAPRAERDLGLRLAGVPAPARDPRRARARRAAADRPRRGGVAGAIDAMRRRAERAVAAGLPRAEGGARPRDGARPGRGDRGAACATSSAPRASLTCSR